MTTLMMRDASGAANRLADRFEARFGEGNGFEVKCTLLDYSREIGLCVVRRGREGYVDFRFRQPDLTDENLDRAVAEAERILR